MADSFAPFRNALQMYAQTAGMPAQAMQSIAMDRRVQEQNAMANALKQLQMDELKRQSQKAQGIDNALAGIFRQRTPGTGPVPGTNYQPGQMEARTPEFSEIQSGLAPLGLEGLLAAEKFRPEATDYQIVQSDTGEYVRVPKNPGYDVDPTGVIGKPQREGTPYYTPVQTADGVFAFNARTGTVDPIDVGGRPIVGSTSDPTLQGALAREKAAGKEVGEATAQAKLDLPRDIQEAEMTVGLVDRLLKHPGFGQAVGKSSILGVQNVPGTDAKAFMIRLNQLKGKQFLQAFQSLKGGGHITEIEGQKATEAVSRMDNASTEGEFIDAAREFQEIVKMGVERAKTKAGQKPPMRGARQAPDGNWYVERGGRFFRVEQ